jgi:signal transduction histidine kinase
MNVTEDFRRGEPGASATGAGVPPAGSLLACFQQALGHELPNQLMSMQGLARLLEDGEGQHLGPEARAQFGRLAALAQETDRLVRALADVGRLCRDARSGGPVALDEVAQEAAAEVHLLYGGPSIVYDFSGDLPAVTVSRQSLYQVLVQLLRNAVQAVGTGRLFPSFPAPGDNPVEAGSAAGRVEVGARRAPDGVEVWVADDGRGLPAVPPEKLFAPFQRGNGLGLGLFLVRSVVAAWGGRLRVESESGRGTRFTLLIPLS